jgi:hypothetical protein
MPKFIKKFIKHIDWKNFKRFFIILQCGSIIFGVIFSVIQLRDVRNMQSAELMLTFNEYLGSETNFKIITLIENNQPILIENGGKFSSAELDNYLSTLELLSNVYFNRLITDDMLYNAFDYTIIKTYQNKEITDYLKKIRQEDPMFFMGFESLAISLSMVE